jgi:flagellar basal body-associated protein FliL
MSEILTAFAGLITLSGTGYFGWFFGRRKTNAEAKSQEIDNDVKLSNHYKEILDDLKGRYENRYKEFEVMMNRKFDMLEEEIKLKDRKIKLQQQEITELKRENRLLRNAKTGST